MNKVLGVIATLALVIAGAEFLQPSEVVVERTIEVSGAIPGSEPTEKINFKGGIAVKNSFGYTPEPKATTTSGASATLVASDLTNIGYHIVTPGGLASAADLTYTLPASTTLKAFVPRIGEHQRTCWFRTATSTDSNIIFAAGTGIDLKYASSTAAADGVPSLAIGSEDELCITFIRQPDGSGTGQGDISGVIENYEHAD